MPQKQYYGKYRGVVTNNQDPNEQGRIQAKVPVVFGEASSPWALPCVPYYKSSVAVSDIPDIGMGIWIEFEGGDSRYPVWTGCWSMQPVQGRVTIRATNKIVIDAPSIELVAGAKDAAVLGEQLLVYLQTLVTRFNTHVHLHSNVPGTPPLDPNPLPPEGMLSTSLKLE
jgi:hypothetical protein